MPVQSKRSRGALLALFVLSVAATASAQILPVAGATDLYDLIPARDRAGIESERAAIRQTEAAADADLIQVRAALEQERGLVEIKKKEIGVIKARVDQAKKAKDDAQRAQLEAQKKAQETEQALLERRVEMRERERDFTEARKKAAEADGAALDRELELVVQRESLRGATAEQLAQQTQRVRDGERAVLNAAREAAAKRAEAQQKDAALFDSRIKVLEAQFAALAARG